MTDTAQLPAASHVWERRRTITWAALLVAIGVVTTVIVGAVVNRERQQETDRADNALVALQQACEQVARLGGHCVTDPGEVGDQPAGLPGADGPPGPVGPRGRPPTQAEIAAAVAAYLAANPPPAGEPGQQGDTGPPGAGAPGVPCPGVWQLFTVRLANGGETIRAFLCIEE